MLHVLHVCYLGRKRIRIALVEEDEDNEAADVVIIPSSSDSGRPSSSSSASTSESSAESDGEPEDEEPAVARPVGRPRLLDPILNDPVAQHKCRLSVATTVKTLLHLTHANRMNQAQSDAVFKFAQTILGPENRMPNLRHARRLAQKMTPLDAIEYAACPFHDCTVLRLPLREIVPDPKCIKCQQNMKDGKGRWKKVSIHVLHIV
jgi:hypothetical protein